MHLRSSLDETRLERRRGCAWAPRRTSTPTARLELGAQRLQHPARAHPGRQTTDLMRLDDPDLLRGPRGAKVWFGRPRTSPAVTGAERRVVIYGISSQFDQLSRTVGVRRSIVLAAARPADPGPGVKSARPGRFAELLTGSVRSRPAAGASCPAGSSSAPRCPRPREGREPRSCWPSARRTSTTRLREDFRDELPLPCSRPRLHGWCTPPAGPPRRLLLGGHTPSRGAPRGAR